MNAKEKKRYNEIVLEIERLQNELKHLNPLEYYREQLHLISCIPTNVIGFCLYFII